MTAATAAHRGVGAAHRALRITTWTALGLYGAAALLCGAGAVYGAVVDRLR